MEANTNLEMNRNNHWHYYFDMWLKPRKTMREIIDQPTNKHHVLLLILLGSFSFTMDKALLKSSGDGLPMPFIFTLLTIVSMIGAAFYYYVIGGLYYWIGLLLGGTGKYRDVRLALAYSNIPVIWGLITWVLLLILFGKENFTSEAPGINNYWYIYMFFVLIDVIIGIWAFFTFLKCLGEAHKFSAWKALLTKVILYIGLFIGSVLIVILQIKLLLSFFPFHIIDRFK